MFDDYDFGAFNYEVPQQDFSPAMSFTQDYDFQGEARPFFDYTSSFDPGYSSVYRSMFGDIDPTADVYSGLTGEVGDVITGGVGGPFSSGPFVPGYDSSSNWLDKLLGGIRGIGGGLGGKAMDFATSRAGMAGLAALLSYLDRQKPTGGGVGAAYAGYKPLTRTVEQSKYGPIARHAAQGGLMQAYAQGGEVRPFPMQDGGFVMTKRAVDGAGGEGGMKQHVPEAVPIRGPGHGTSDSIHATIQGKHGVTPAKVSNGEMYIPPGRSTQGLYALMKSLERKA